MAETYLANHLYNEALKELKQLVGKHPEYAKRVLCCRERVF